MKYAQLRFHLRDNNEAWEMIWYCKDLDVAEHLHETTNTVESRNPWRLLTFLRTLFSLPTQTAIYRPYVQGRL